jgi:hypothetical protein
VNRYHTNSSQYPTISQLPTVHRGCRIRMRDEDLLCQEGVREDLSIPSSAGLASSIAVLASLIPAGCCSILRPRRAVLRSRAVSHCRSRAGDSDWSAVDAGCICPRSGTANGCTRRKTKASARRGLASTTQLPWVQLGRSAGWSIQLAAELRCPNHAARGGCAR